MISQHFGSVSKSHRRLLPGPSQSEMISRVVTVLVASNSCHHNRITIQSTINLNFSAWFYQEENIGFDLSQFHTADRSLETSCQKLKTLENTNLYDFPQTNKSTYNYLSKHAVEIIENQLGSEDFVLSVYSQRLQTMNLWELGRTNNSIFAKLFQNAIKY